MTCNELELSINSWLEYLKLEEKSKNTIIQYKGALKTFLKFANQEGISEITKEIILKYKNYLNNLKVKGEIKTSTLNVKLIALNEYLKYLGLDDLKVKTQKRQANNTFKECMTENDYLKLLKYTEFNKNSGNNYRNHLLMRVLGETGIRISELEFFTVPALENMNGKLTVVNKGKERDIFIPKDLKYDLLNYAYDNDIENIIFHGMNVYKENGKRVSVKDDNKPLDKTVIWRTLKSIAIKAGVNDKLVHAHSFRHRFALQFLSSKGNDMQALINLSRILGHSSLETTRYYLNVSDKELEEEITGIHNK